MITIDTYNAIYDKHRKLVEKKIELVFKKRKPQYIYEPAEYILKSGGKRIRPVLLLLCAQAFKKNPNEVINAALAVEMLHNFTLIHDDIMDNADQRRGRETLHVKYDENIAILSGDALLAVAYEYLLKDCKDKNASKIIGSFTKALVEVCEGQSYDKEFETMHYVSLKDYYMMIHKKTAAMLEMCCEAGALLGGGSTQEIQALKKYGYYIGMAFQVQDDLLDLLGSPEFGKKKGGDLIEGKKSFLFINAYEKADGDNKIKLDNFLKNKGIKPKEVPDFEKMFHNLNVFKAAEKEINNFTNKAKKAINILKNKESIYIFNYLADSLIKRNK